MPLPLRSLTHDLVRARPQEATVQDLDGEFPQRDVLTVQETAQRLGVHANTVRKWVRSGYIPSGQPAGARGRILIPSSVLRSLTGESVVVPEALERSLSSGAFPCRTSGYPSNNEETVLDRGCWSLSETVNALLGLSPPSKRPRPPSATSAKRRRPGS